ncbi:MAG: FAD-dependent thymidylate synthase [Candidatus Thermoplasmatota archaeon]|jgi:thymidylate synthase ThyX|nr:FAD-dependent thymidylate synthase [Candidatus Thermoplasmatota archaeon]MCL5963173.1 FAD-dependent thymidylate synthase [Candidatus Thermoplasmatota archaeon]
MNKKRIYVMENLSPETIAVTFAKTSRSPEPFDEIAKGLTEEKSSKFNEKWIIGYGHSSVAEHATLSIAIENVSRIAGEVIESSRLASFTEKSTRYQKIDKENFFIPGNIQSEDFLKDYMNICNDLVDLYSISYERINSYFGNALNDVKKAKHIALDNARYLLPLSTLTNIGVTANARVMEHMVSKMLSSNIKEVEEIGIELKREALKRIPTLIKYASKNDFIKKQNDLDKYICNASPSEIPVFREQSLPVPALLYGDFEKIDLLNKILYYAHDNRCFDDIVPDPMLDFIEKNMESHDELPRETEHLAFTFELLIDESVYYELKRHRMCTLSSQPHNIMNGFYIPEIFYTLSLQNEVMNIIDRVKEFYIKYQHDNINVIYALPNLTMRRVLLSSNLRELRHIYRLRNADNAHFAIRYLVKKIKEVLVSKNRSIETILNS